MNARHGERRREKKRDGESDRTVREKLADKLNSITEQIIAINSVNAFQWFAQ